MVRTVVELIEQSIVLVFLELKLGALEIKRNIDSAKTGAAFMGLGGFLLLFSLLGLMATAIAALALVLPVWLSALIVSAVLIFAGGALLVTGLGKLKHFSVVPKDTVDRVENIGRQLKHHAEQRHAEEEEAREAEHARAMATVREATQRSAGLEGRNAVEAGQLRKARELRKARKLAKANARELTRAKEAAAAREERERKEKAV
jgi:hypothetical protein